MKHPRYCFWIMLCALVALILAHPFSTAAATTYVADYYNRILTGSWGSAPLGGPYTLSGAAANFNVNGTSGTITTPANVTNATYLNSVSLLNVDATFRVETDKLAAGGAFYAFFVVRHTNGNDYLARLRVSTDNVVRIMAAKEVNGSATLLGTETGVNLNYYANVFVWMHVQVLGTNPTTIKLRAWQDGSAEPSTWQYTVTDSDSHLQTAGSVGFRCFLSSSATNSPMLFSFGALNVADPGVRSIPAFDHIFIVLEENHAYSEIIGNTAAPYLNSLAQQNGLATNYTAITHPSLPNYLALTGGSTFGITTDCAPSTCPINARNLADNLEAAGKTWKGYMESMPGPCTTTDSGQYAVRHDPFVYFNDILTNATRCSSRVVPYTALANDLSATATTPSLVWITPNVCNDMHDCSISTGDTWLQKNLPTIFNSPAWTTQKSVLFITWDEDDSTSGNHVATLVIGPAAKAGYQSAAAYTHDSLLHTIESAWGLATLTANDANAPLMSDFWR